jgi:hypothetical protein
MLLIWHDHCSISVAKIAQVILAKWNIGRIFQCRREVKSFL